MTRRNFIKLCVVTGIATFATTNGIMQESKILKAKEIHILDFDFSEEIRRDIKSTFDRVEKSFFLTGDGLI